ncbi:MAG: LysM peptidoglycan-binding domain-containing protein [Chloroherpetonaceae bacterium]|nr:LysM peptidoglycan-binding domain-containing protein [Chthonomonadaceae bacterium]MDW8206805.1 LysM peptidoglycan-binding domain-containing protein [Chloroherpetonaceae bacterium]
MYGNSERTMRNWQTRSACLTSLLLIGSVPVSGQGEARVHRVQRGETLNLLAKTYGVSLHRLAAANHLPVTARLQQGQSLRIPIEARSPEARPEASRPSVPLPGKSSRRRVSFSFARVDVRQALTTISDYSGADIMVMPGARGHVSISLRDRTPDEAVRLTAAAAGLSVVQIGNTYMVGKPEELQPVVNRFGETRIVPLQHTPAREAKELLSRVTPLVHVQPMRGGVLLAGMPADVHAAVAALQELERHRPDAPTAQVETGIFTLRHCDPEMTERVLKEAFPAMRVVRRERTLVLTGTGTQLTTAGQALKQMDAEPATPGTAQEEVLVYRLKYLNAQTAETSLKKALPGLNVAVAPEPTAPPAASFMPLSINTLGVSGNDGAPMAGMGGPFGGAMPAAGGTGVPGTGAQEQPLSRSVRLILIGPQELIRRARMLLEQTDVPPPLVRIEAALIEVNRSTLRDLGLNWDFSATQFTFTIPGGTGLDFGRILRDVPRRDDPEAPESRFTVALQALVAQNRARILAAPNISVVDNEDANIFIGDLLRFRGINVVTPNAGTVQGVDTIPVGIALLVRPRIHPDGEVTLKVHPVVSSVTGFVDGLPQTASREADTTVRLKAGEELVIGGLSRKEFITALQKVPLLGDLPIIGQLFQTRNQRVNETEIIVCIRAYPVMTRPAPEDRSGAIPEDAPVRDNRQMRPGQTRPQQEKR